MGAVSGAPLAVAWNTVYYNNAPIKLKLILNNLHINTYT